MSMNIFIVVDHTTLGFWEVFASTLRRSRGELRVGEEDRPCLIIGAGIVTVVYDKPNEKSTPHAFQNSTKRKKPPNNSTYTFSVPKDIIYSILLNGHTPIASWRIFRQSFMYHTFPNYPCPYISVKGPSVRLSREAIRVFTHHHHLTQW